VIVDQKGGNSLLYLPLDKLMETTRQANTGATSKPATTNEEELMNEDSRSLSRDREGR
jgi:membrane protease subunit HflK